jgi:hypothetical protein
MVATTTAVTKHLGAGGGLLYRYLPDDSPDGLAGHEGAFLLCSFWLVDNLAKQGRLDEAHQLYDSLCARANPLGLPPEQIDPSTGAFMGNYPQAFSHMTSSPAASTSPHSQRSTMGRWSHRCRGPHRKPHRRRSARRHAPTRWRHHRMTVRPFGGSAR